MASLCSVLFCSPLWLLFKTREDFVIFPAWFRVYVREWAILRTNRGRLLNLWGNVSVHRGSYCTSSNDWYFLNTHCNYPPAVSGVWSVYVWHLTLILFIFVVQLARLGVRSHPNSLFHCVNTFPSNRHSYNQTPTAFWRSPVCVQYCSQSVQRSLSVCVSVHPSTPFSLALTSAFIVMKTLYWWDQGFLVTWPLSSNFSFLFVDWVLQNTGGAQSVWQRAEGSSLLMVIFLVSNIPTLSQVEQRSWLHANNMLVLVISHRFW